MDDQLKKTIETKERLQREQRMQLRELQHSIRRTEYEMVQLLVSAKLIHCLRVDWTQLHYTVR